MDKPLIGKILSSLESKSLPELRDLTDSLAGKYVSGPKCDQAESQKQDAQVQAAWTPYYTLIMVSTGHDPDDPGNTVRICKALRELIPGLSLREAKQRTDDAGGLPMKVISVVDEHPGQIRARLRPVLDSLEAQGFVFEEDYSYGYYD